jgi:hypothetical protein
MLTMRPDWSQLTSGAIATMIFEQISCPPHKMEFARHIIGASLELLIAGLCKKTPVPLLKEAICDFRWQINDTTYVFFPDIDDDALDKAVEFCSILPTVIIIAPSGYAKILENACRHKFLSLEDAINPGRTTGGRQRRQKLSRSRSSIMQTSANKNMPLIFPLDSFISFRTSFTGADLNWTKNHVLLELFRRYNRRAIHAVCNEAILIDIPPE